jgi:hypothetical protein
VRVFFIKVKGLLFFSTCRIKFSYRTLLPGGMGADPEYAGDDPML